MEIKKSHQVKSVAFQGYQTKKTETGAQSYHFNALYDASKYDCELQIFSVGKDRKGNLFIKEGPDGAINPIYTKPVPKEGAVIEPFYDLDLDDKEPFAYRMALKHKGKDEIAHYLREDSSNANGFTIITRVGPNVVQRGPMYLAIADTYAPGYVYAGFKDKNTGEVIEPDYNQKKEITKKVRKTNRTFGTVAGGTMAGLEAKIPEIAEAGNKRLITTPLQGGATASADKYWNENNFLTAGGIGNRNNLASLQRKAFRYGMNTVDDGTFTSEGLQGIHFQRAIKWMDNEDIPDEFYYFRMMGLKNDSLGLGIVPKNFENMSCKIVNAPFDIVQKKDGTYDMPENKAYDPERPTEIQVFDRLMATPEQIKDKTHIFTSYGKTTPDTNKLAINTHDDTVIPYHFEVSPTELRKNINNLNEVNLSRKPQDRIKYDSPRGTMFIGTMSGLRIDPKTEGGFVCWNAYTDMSKLNYFASNYDMELLSEIKNPAKRDVEYKNLRRANYQLRDMACQVARYRTANARKNFTEYTAKTLGMVSSNPDEAYEHIFGLIDTQNPKDPRLPYDMIPEKNVVQNVIEDNYEFRNKHENYDDAVIASLMELPLDSIEFAPEVQGALSSPYISKRSSDEEHITETRFDAMNDSSYKVPDKYAKTYNKVNEVFTKDIKAFADKVLAEVNKNSEEKLFDETGEMTEYGKYLIPLVGQDIARYAVTKALMPSAKAKLLKDGEVVYDYDDMTERGTLAHMNINGDSQKDEANQIVNRLQKGVNRLMNDNVKFMAESINKRFVNTNANSLKLAEVMIERSGYGLDWRFDAAKDVVDMDSVYNKDQTTETAKKNNVRFWGDMVKVINEENPNSYTVAEVTNMDDNFTDALINLAGITSEANYSYFFDGISDMFGYIYTSGQIAENNMDRLEDSLKRFSNRSIDYKRNSYTFASNHDKPRMIHCLSMDMKLFHTDLNDKSNKDYRKTAYMIMNDKLSDQDLNEYDWKVINGDINEDYFKNVNSKAIANGELLRSSIGIINERLKNEAAERLKTQVSPDKYESEKSKSDDRYAKIYTLMSRAVADVVNGKYYKNMPKKESSRVDSYKTVLEKDGFGTKPVTDAFDIIYDQAVYINENEGLIDRDKMLSEKELIEYRNRVDSQATEVGRTKTRIIMRYLSALSGNPTLYAGDEYGMTGYEDPCQNTYLQNRSPIDHFQTEIVKDENGNNINEYFRKDIHDYKENIYDIFRTRKSDEMYTTEALNDGVMYKLNKQHTKNGLGCSAVMYQASNGAMNISLFNPNGISISPKAKPHELVPTPLELESINLIGKNGKISITPNIEFKNVNPNDTSVYKVCELENGEYCLKRYLDNNKCMINMDETNAPDGVMMLYYIPENVQKSRAETAQRRKVTREYYNPVHNIPQSDAYTNVNKPDDKNGKNFDVTSKG